PARSALRRAGWSRCRTCRRGARRAPSWPPICVARSKMRTDVGPGPREHDRASRVQLAAVATLGLALLAAAAVGTYEASLAKAHAVRTAVRDAVPGTTPSAVQYLPGSTAQIATIEQPRTEGRRA